MRFDEQVELLGDVFWSVMRSEVRDACRRARDQSDVERSAEALVEHAALVACRRLYCEHDVRALDVARSFAREWWTTTVRSVRERFPRRGS